MASQTITPSHWRVAFAGLQTFTLKRKPTPKTAERVQKLLKRLEGLWWNEQVLGFSVAEKRSGGRGTGETAVRFYVRRKVSSKRLRPEWRIPKALTLEGKGEEAPARIETDVVEMLAMPLAQTRVVNPGDSVGHLIGTNGAVGLAVDGNTSGRFLLTCAHVASPPIAQVGDAIESPADRDGEAGPNTIGQLYWGMNFKAGGKYDLDAALVKPRKGVELTNRNLRLGPAPQFAVITPANQADYRGHALERLSFGSGHVGVFDSIQNDIPVLVNNVVARFYGMYAYRGKTRDGDSGSPVINTVTNELLGLHFAGSEKDELGFVVPFGRLAQKLKVRIAAE